MNDCVTGASKYTRNMLTHRASIIAFAGPLLLLAGMAGPAAAQDGSFSVTFEEVTSNCDAKETGIFQKKGSLQLTSTPGGVQLQITGLPVMRGIQRDGGKLKAEAKDTDGKGLRRHFRASGRAQKDEVHILVIAEFYRGDTSLCTQSWNVTGKRR